MFRNFPAAVLAILTSYNCDAALAGAPNAQNMPPIVPGADEMAIRAVAVLSIHVELDQCIKDAAAILTSQAHSALNAHIDSVHTYLSQSLGYIVRADFTRNGVSPPLVNRIICWQDGQLIVWRVPPPPLPASDNERLLAVPSALPSQHH